MLNHAEQKAVAALAAIFALRMCGLFLLLPVLAPYAQAMGGSAVLTGLALGVYGVTQGALQIPFGLASDRIGRKRVITFGLLIFALGGVWAALAESIEMLIFARAVQGGGAVSAAALALAADFTRAEERTTAMAFIGVSIGAAFLLSLMAAPPLQNLLGVGGMFWLSAAFGLGAIALLWGALPPEPRTRARMRSADFRAILKDRELLRLNFGAFSLHAALTALFVALPAQFLAHSALPPGAHWKLYAPVLLLSALGTIPLLMWSRRRAAAFRGGVGILLAGALALAVFGGRGLGAMLAALCVFFTAFNALEAMLPSRVSTRAPAAAKGAAMGVFNTWQFFGMFAGGVGAGLCSARFGVDGVFWLCVGFAAVWVAVTFLRAR